MHPNEVLNLDRIAARYAQKIIKDTAEKKAKDVENLVTKALGVLQENGVYACILYLFSRKQEKEKEIAQAVRKELYDLAVNKLNYEAGNGETPEEVLKFYSETVCKELEPLLLAKEVFEQTLIYARFGAKARDGA